MSEDQDYDKRPERSLVTSSEDGRVVEVADTVRGWWLRFGENLGDGEFCNKRAEEWIDNDQAVALAAIFLSGRSLPDDLPSWVSMHATATGADLIEHDANGDQWERSWVGKRWNTNHNAAAERDRRYLVRRRPAPVEPTTEKVPWWEARERWVTQTLRITEVGCDEIGPWWKSNLGVTTHTLKFSSDGMVTVLREDGAS